jgi:type IX secretion system PorP/SprF family membrane protein
MKIKIIIIFLSVSPLISLSQDFAHINAGKLFYNPSFAGSSVVPKLSLDYQGQGFDNYSYGLAQISYDQYFHMIRSGLGVYISDIWLRDNFNGYVYSHLSYYAMFSPSIPVAKKFMIKPSIYFGNCVDKYNNTGYQYYLPSPETYTEFGFGMLLYSEKLFAGFSFRDINTPTVNNNTLPVEMILNFGGIIGKKDLGSKAILLFPFLIYDEVSDYDSKLIKLGLDSRIHSILLGIHFNTYALSDGQDYMSALVGFNYHQLRLAYSYEFNTSKLSENSTGKHEVSLIWSFNLKNFPVNVIPFPETGF